MLPNGILLSCAYDKLVIAWAYQKEEEIKRYEKQEQLRCMDYIETQGKLFVGTNNRQILTIDIQPLLDLDNCYGDAYSSAKKGFGESRFLGMDSIQESPNIHSKFGGLNLEEMEGMDEEEMEQIRKGY